jgi:hypothetical protein
MISIAAALFLFEPKVHKARLFLYLSCIIFSGLTIFLTGSRTGIIATGGGLAYVAFVSLKSLGRVRIARFVAAAVLVTPIIVYKFSQVLMAASGRVVGEVQITGSLENRLERQLTTLNHAVTNLRGGIFGCGGASLAYTNAAFGLSKPHNEYLQHLQESGWTGLIMYLVLMLVLFRRFRPRVGPHLAVYGIAGRGALFAGMICGLATAFMTFTSSNRIIYGVVISFIFGRLCLEMRGYRQQYQLDPYAV